MNLRHIEIFHAVYVNGSVSAAARALNVSQPSVSKTLRHAETLLGFELFQRSNGRLLPTEDAHALFADVADIQERVRALREAGRNLRMGAGTTLRISALPSLGLGVLPDAVSRFLARRPDVRFDLQTVHHDDLLRKLYERESDIAIASEPPRGVALTHDWLGEGEMVVLYRERDMPDAPPRLELSQLVGRPLISLKGSGPIGKLLSEEIDRHDLVLDEIVVARTFYIAAALVRAGVGLAIVDNFTAAASMAPGLAMRPLRPSITFDVHAIHLLDRPPSMLAAEFLTLLSEEIERR
ncbi:DNA-binding transcriptional LysR family regulator [Sphingomonas sp. SORGH_AS 950]|uniref:LysR family transcriptional regulator n=1 Tax=unclassified Sphingomonas TaxID=196159 RepID=UPI0027886325|nr:MULTISPECIES: LysR family transcriptional regulator [unclassified Sphingomonas]MDQ1155918.1 DNA-binding transcriptional LysR family regulator [Sphingomonas sp. SORGH_AS_0950]MDR6116214.1 DNA-binding transcriptional LysR family regulator [Sphingomonas sp. SORGH_AS_0789]MDR6150111.1 DNA-binding transcriptional LysR family regulator [Sphingomonas sp. SORGH_AS_0742]